MQKNNYMDIMEKNHMEIPWHDYTENDSNVLINKAGLIEKASVIGRVGLIMLSCGTGAWRVRTSMNRLAKELGVTCTVDVGLMSIEFNCFDGKECVSQSLSIANTGVNTSKLYRMEQFVDNFPKQEAHLTGEEIHRRLDEIESIHTLYSPAKLGLAAALACCAFTFLLGGGPIEMVLAFIAAGIGNVIRTKLIKHHYTLFLNIAVSISAACLTYTVCLHLAEMLFHIPSFHEAGYICSMLFIIPGFPFITSGIDLAKLDLRSGTGTPHLFRDHRAGRYHVCMDHGIALKIAATGFFLIIHRSCPSSVTAVDHKFLRCIRILYYVQQFDPDGSHGCLYRCHRKYIASGTGQLYGYTCRCRRFYRRINRRTSGFHHKKMERLSTYFTNRSIHCYYGSRTLPLSCNL